VVFTVGTLRKSTDPISALDLPWPTATATSRSRVFSRARRSLARVRRSWSAPATRSMSRLVTAGDSTGSPWATRRTASTISAGGVSLRTNPAAPARRTCSSASKVVRMITSGAWRRARRASVAASPSIAGIRMSIRTTSGAYRSTMGSTTARAGAGSG
jgi:hypothetical protein